MTASCSLNVLVIDEWIPYPPDMGKRVRTWNLLRRLAKRHTITLLGYGEPWGEAATAVRSAGVCLHTVASLAAAKAWRLYPRLFANLFSPYPYSVSKHYTRRFRERLECLLSEERFDVVHCEWTPYARFLPALDWTHTLVMTHNIESQIWARRAHYCGTLLGRAFFSLQARKMKRFERATLLRAARVAAVTPLDAAQLAAWGVRDVSLVENGVDLNEFVPGTRAHQPGSLLFLGSLDWYPNLDALDYFLKDIMPLVRLSLPRVNLQVVGKGPASGLHKRLAKYGGVEFVGEVADVRPFLAQAAVVVVPLRIGGGSRIKILESLAMGKPVVTTSIGAEGLAVLDGIHVSLADAPAEFADRTVELLTSLQRRRQFGEAGRRLVVERYSWDRAAEALDSAWHEVCRPRQDSQQVNSQKERAEQLFAVDFQL
jgi:polysaccharide biosynthesis protein PslH